MKQHPLSTALSPLLPISPSFIYLHHPYHSSSYALPADFESEEGALEEESGPLGLKQEVDARVRAVTVKVDLGALASGADQKASTGVAAPDPTGSTISQKTFYNAVLRTTFSVITRKIIILEVRHHASDGAPSTTSKTGKRKSTRGTVDPFDTATQSFEETFRPLVGKDVYRWDVFLTRLRSMLDAFKHIIDIGLEKDDMEGEMGIGLVLMILESQLLQKCLGATWHALLRLNEMVRYPELPEGRPLIHKFRSISAPQPSCCVLSMLGTTSSLSLATRRSLTTRFSMHPTKIVSTWPTSVILTVLTISPTLRNPARLV